MLPPSRCCPSAGRGRGVRRSAEAAAVARRDRGWVARPPVRSWVWGVASPCSSAGPLLVWVTLQMVAQGVLEAPGC